MSQHAPGRDPLPASDYLYKEGCPKCGSSDAFAIYSDGHAHCFSCAHHTPPTGQQPKTQGARPVASKELITGEVRPLTKRGITEETCQKWGYLSGTLRDRPVHIAQYRDGSGNLVGQKIRFPDKDFTVLGSIKEAGLYGQWLWRDTGKMVVITEGEIDALTVSQLQGNKWPVVSVPNGAQGAAKAVAGSLEWLSRFDHVVFMLDMDEQGRKATEECVAILPPGKAKVATLPLKDANAMLQAGRGSEVIDAIWGAKVYRPNGIVTLTDIRDSVMKPPEQGLPWCFQLLTDVTYGRRLGECYAVGAGTGVGKTDFLTQQIVMDTIELQQKVGVFFLEQSPAETAKRIAGKFGGKCFHIPGDGWTQEELITAYDKMESSGMLFLNDHFGMADWDTIKEHIRFLHHAEGVNIFYLDHLTALASGSDDERVELERIMSEIGSLVKELNVMLTLVSHLATPEGKSHEEGGRVMIRHFKGSRAIGFWSHYMFGLERDQQAEDVKERGVTTFRVLKDRYTGRATGFTFYLSYNPDTGRLFELDGNPFAEDALGQSFNKEEAF